jgi:CBS domain-containing protein
MRAFIATVGVDKEEIAAVLDAFFFIQILRLRHDIFDVGDTASSPNRINPERLNPLERRILKEALRSARRVQKRLALDYQA